MKCATFVSLTASPKLERGAVYFADNGATICLDCAGLSAKFTGRDISGQKVKRVKVEEVREWERQAGRPMACEGGCTVLSALAGPDGWPVPRGIRRAIGRDDS